jgi:hypothetical protein
MRSTKVLTIIAVALFGACARGRLPDLESGERRAFRASSVHSSFFIVGEFEGVAEIERDSIVVFVTRGRIETRERLAHDVALRVALANGDTSARWRVGDASSATPISTIRRDDDGNLLDALRFSVKRPRRPLSEHWLVFVFEAPSAERAADGRPLLHTAFAHSQPDVFVERATAGLPQP